jgi:hypothetical protein
VNYGLRWDAQHFPGPVTPPADTAYGFYLSNPLWPSDGTIHNQNKMFQPRVGFAWDVRGNGKSVLRASAGIFNARQNMLTQVGAITTNGVQQQEIDGGFVAGNFLFPTYPQVATPAPLPPGSFPQFAGVTVFSKDYANPRIYAYNAAYEQEIFSGWAGYIDLSISKGVHLTRFVNPNVCCSSADLALSPDSDVNGGSGPSYCVKNASGVCTGPTTSPFTAPNHILLTVTDTASSANSLYRGATIGVRRNFRNRFQLDANYVWSEDLDDDSNERDPFTFRYLDFYNLRREYSYSDRDEKHKFNFMTHAELPYKFNVDVRMQAHTAQPATSLPTTTPSGPVCSPTNANHRVLLNPTTGTLVDCGRNFVRKDNGFFAFNFGIARPISLGERMRIIPKLEMFNTFNNKNNVSSSAAPVLFNFDGFLREGVGDPRQAQLSVRFEF